MKPPLFHVGQAVVFLGGPPFSEAFQGLNLPSKGRAYTVRHVREGINKYTWCILLKEIVNPPYGPLQLEQAFVQERFAPIEEMPDEALAELLEEAFTPVAV